MIFHNILLNLVQGELPFIGQVLMTTISPLASAGGTFLIMNKRAKNEREKMKLEAKLQQEKASEERKLYKDELNGVNLKLSQMAFTLNTIDSDNKFKSRLTNVIRRKATHHIDYNTELLPKYKNVIMKIAREFEDFAFKFYYSDMRGLAEELGSFLEIDMASRISTIENEFCLLKEPPRAFRYSNGKVLPMVFKDYLNLSGKLKTVLSIDFNDKLTPSLHSSIDNLLEILKRNGLSSDDVIDRFSDFTSKFFKSLIGLLNKWEDLELYEPKEEDYDG